MAPSYISHAEEYLFEEADYYSDTDVFDNELDPTEKYMSYDDEMAAFEDDQFAEAYGLYDDVDDDEYYE
jgi:hypothetical protein